MKYQDEIRPPSMKYENEIKKRLNTKVQVNFNIAQRKEKTA